MWYCESRVCTFSGEVLGSTHGLAAEVAHHVVHRGLMPEEDGPNNFVVDDLGAVPCHRGHAPQQEETLEPQRMGKHGLLELLGQDFLFFI